MPVPTRPYFVVFNGRRRMVEASSPAQAVQHLVGAAVTDLRPAVGAEVATWVREGGKIELAGEPQTENASPAAELVIRAECFQPESPTQEPTIIGEQVRDEILFWNDPRDSTVVAIEQDEGTPQFLPDDAIDWLVEHGARQPALSAFGRMRAEDRMTLELFDIARHDCPDFAEAIVLAVAPAGPTTRFWVDDVRNHLEDQPIPFEVVVGAIGEAKRRDLYLPEGETEPPSEEQSASPA